MERKVMRRIVNIIKKSDGITINEIARRARIHRLTASKYVMALYFKRMVKIQHVGRAKLIFPTKRIDDWEKALI